MRSETQLQEHHAWSPPRDDRGGSTEHSYGYKHSHVHHNRGHERNTDDDDSKDENDDDDSEDDDDSKDKNDEHDKDSSDSSESQSGSGSSSGNETESAAIQSSVVTNLDGVNIGNTITIINIGTGSGGHQSSSASANNDLNGNSSFAVSAAGRSAVTSAAIRAFCDSIGCSSAQGSKTSTSVPGSGSASFSFGGRNGSRGREATYEMPAMSSEGSVAELSTWLVLVSILIQVL
ncbi:hypothetical protein PRIC1_000601 [Phytophthora ramorum]